MIVVWQRYDTAVGTEYVPAPLVAAPGQTTAMRSIAIPHGAQNKARVRLESDSSPQEQLHALLLIFMPATDCVLPSGSAC